MQVTAKLLDHDVATRFGHASGPCVSPPEEDYRTEEWEVEFLLLPAQDSVDEIADILNDPQEVAHSTIQEATDMEDWEWDDKVFSLHFQSPKQPDHYGALLFTFGIVATQPFRRTGGSYERL